MQLIKLIADLTVRPLFQKKLFLFTLIVTLTLPKIVNEYDQEIPQSQTADNPVAP